MARAKGGVKARRRHNKWLKLAKGFRGRRSNVFKVAKLAVIHALTYSYSDRKRKKRDIKRLWNIRINAGVRAIDAKNSYSKFMHGLKKANIALDRKILAALAIEDEKTFACLVETSKSA